MSSSTPGHGCRGCKFYNIDNICRSGDWARESPPGEGGLDVCLICEGLWLPYGANCVTAVSIVFVKLWELAD